MKLDRLRARLDRLEQSKVQAIGEDRARDEERREQLFRLKLRPGLSKSEEAEYARLNELFRERDKRRNRRDELSLLPFTANRELTAAEKIELEPLNREFPPLARIDDPLAKSLDFFDKMHREERLTAEHAPRRVRPSSSTSDEPL
jgi:hypothetical protein